MLVSAVTGDVGAGKSTLTGFWRDAGASVVDADEIVRSLWSRPEVVTDAVSRWGSGIMDATGAIIPSRVALRAFGDEEEYRWLCALLHPLVRIEMERRVASMEGWIVAEIPLLFESGPPAWIDVSVYVSAPAENRRDRNSVRGWDDLEIVRRESFLLPPDEKKRRASLVLENSGELDDFRALASHHASVFKRLSSIVQCRILFSKFEDAGRYAEYLRKERLGTEFSCVPVETFERSEKRWSFTFFTMESWFSLLSQPHLMDAVRGPYFERIRRIPWSRRLTLSGELRS
jgi:dephospho-CoA kinase